MRQFLPAVLLLLLWPSHALAIDLSIKDPVISNLEISFTASLSATSNYYLQGVIRSQSSSKYFGETQNSKGDWVDYVSSPEKEFIASNFFITDVKNATWSGQLKMRFKVDDPNYLGSGLYDLKLRRFTGGSSSSAGESNALTINLTAPQPTPTPAPTVTPTSTPLAVPTSIPTERPTLAPSVSPTPHITDPPSGTVAGESTTIDLSGFGVLASPKSQDEGGSPPKPTLNKTRAKTALLLGAGLIIISISGYFGYRKYKSLYNQE